MGLTIHPIVLSRLAMEAGRLSYLREYGKRTWIPCPFFVILGGAEPILVDTSGSAEVMSGIRIEPVEHVLGFEEGLASLGLRAGDIRTVIQTHLMYDHCANSKKLINARFIVQKKDLEFALDPHPMVAEAYQRVLFENLPFEVVEGDVDLFPGVRLLFTPGHTPGIQSVAVSTDSGQAIITGFCCTLENFYPQKSQAWVTDRTPEVIPPGIHTDMLQAYESAVRVKKMAEIIIPIHDPVMTEKAKIP